MTMSDSTHQEHTILRLRVWITCLDGKADGRGRHSPNRVGEAGPEPVLSLLGFKKAEMATGVSWAVAGAGVERIASTILTGRGRG